MSSHKSAYSYGTAVLSAAAMLVGMLATPDAAQAQTRDKWLTVVTAVEPPDLEGCQSARTIEGRIVKQNIVETLIEKDGADGSLKPRLATAWKRVDDSTWTFDLRKGVTFHDGSPFNAAAVKTSIDRTMGVGTPIVCEDKIKVFSDLKIELTPLDEHTLQIRTARPDPILPMRISGLAISGPKTPLDKPSLAPVGTGPYVFERWNAGVDITVKRNESYWGAKPQAEGVRYIWRDVSAVRAAMVKIGEADLALALASEDATDPALDHAYSNAETSYMRIDMTRPPLDDKRVRQALNYAVDRQAMIGTIMPKDVTRATQIVGTAIPGHNFELDKNQYAYDPAKAKQLLAEAKADGVPVDTEITLVSYPPQFPNAAQLMEAVLTMYHAVGLKMKLTSVDPAAYRSWNNKPFAENRPPSILQASHDNVSGDPVFSIPLKYGCDGNTSVSCDKELDQEILRVSGLEGQARAAGWNGVLRRIYVDLVPMVVLHHMVGFIRIAPRIDYQPNGATNVEVAIQKIKFK